MEILIKDLHSDLYVQAEDDLNIEMMIKMSQGSSQLNFNSKHLTIYSLITGDGDIMEN